MVKMSKSQVSLHITWIFILIAGALILLFFVGLVVKQKDIAETKLAAVIVTKLENLFAGTRISTGASTFLSIPESEFSFVCDEDSYSEFSIKDTGISRETPDPIFAPSSIKGNQLITWSLDFSAPFRATHVLYITSPNIKYVMVYDDSNNFAKQINSSLPTLITKEHVTNSDYLTTLSQGYKQIKFIFFGTLPNPPIPSDLQNKDISITAINIPSGNQIDFYKVENNQFVQTGTSYYLTNPSLYGAIFAESQISYECNLKKIFKRLNLVTELYKQKAGSLEIDYFADPYGPCRYLFSTSKDPLLNDLKTQSESCFSSITQSCISTISSIMVEIQTKNNNLEQNSCPYLY